MKLSHGERFRKGLVRYIDFLKQLSRLRHIRALTENPRDKFKLCDIVLSLPICVVMRVADEIQPRRGESLFIDGVVIQRISSGDICHADYRIMIFRISHMPEPKRKFPRCYCDFVAVGKFVVKGPSEIKIFCLISCRRAHIFPPSFIRLYAGSLFVVSARSAVQGNHRNRLHSERIV